MNENMEEFFGYSQKIQSEWSWDQSKQRLDWVSFELDHNWLDWREHYNTIYNRSKPKKWNSKWLNDEKKHREGISSNCCMTRKQNMDCKHCANRCEEGVSHETVERNFTTLAHWKALLYLLQAHSKGSKYTFKQQCITRFLLAATFPRLLTIMTR
jgi:hypothetical protein